MVDFATLKAETPIERVFGLLNVNLKQHGDQWRGSCPACKRGGDRALAINTARNSFYCFSAKKGGDVISLVEHVQGLSARDAALAIARHTGTVPHSSPSPQTSQASPASAGAKKPFDPEAYFKELDTTHASLAELGISEGTCAHFQCGFRSRGVLASRIAVRIDDAQGNFLAFIGRAIDGEPVWKYPSGFDPAAVVFNAHRITEGEVRLAKDVPEVLAIYEHTGENAICFLTELIEAAQHELLAGLQDAKGFKVFY